MSQYTINTVCNEYTPAITISGQVFDANTKQPLPFSNIYHALDSTIGTAADEDGKFTIDIPTGHTLVASFVGYHPKTFITGNGFTEVFLTPDDQLEPAIIYGENKKRNYSWLWWLFLGGVAIKAASNTSKKKKPALGQPMNVKI